MQEPVRLTLKENAKLCQATKIQSLRKALVRLVLANVLVIHPQEADDFFYVERDGSLIHSAREISEFPWSPSTVDEPEFLIRLGKIFTYFSRFLPSFYPW